MQSGKLRKNILMLSLSPKRFEVHKNEKCIGNTTFTIQKAWLYSGRLPNECRLSKTTYSHWFCTKTRTSRARHGGPNGNARRRLVEISSKSLPSVPILRNLLGVFALNVTDRFDFFVPESFRIRVKTTKMSAAFEYSGWARQSLLESKNQSAVLLFENALLGRQSII